MDEQNIRLSKNFQYMKYLFLFLLCCANMFYMHYTIISTCSVEWQLYLLSYIDNFASVIFEVIIIFLVLLFFLRRKAKIAIIVCFILTLIWSFSNIIYSRFFHQYLSLSAFNQIGSLFDGLIVDCIINEFQWGDLYFILIPFLFSFIYRKSEEKHIRYSNIKYYIVPLLFPIVLVGTSHFIYCCSNPAYRYFSYYIDNICKKHFYPKSVSIEPIYATFHRGSIRMIISEFVQNLSGPLNLSEHQMLMINDEIEDDINKQGITKSNSDVKNVVFILVESYMAFVSDMVVDGKEITPNLNSLKKDSTVYYNGSVLPNVTIGESSDGQFIYMSGLLPLRSKVTISKVLKNRIPGMADILKRNKEMQTRMIIPTSISMWKQDIMCQKYGFDCLYSSKDFKNMKFDTLNDEQLFELVKEVDSSNGSPFFSVILTMSMHQPYTKYIDESFLISDKAYPESLKNYLNACYYTDKQIGKYVEFLKGCNLFDNTLIIITSDHNVPSNAISLLEGMDDQSLPLYILNSGIPKDSWWYGKCNQLDVYTTILDVLGLQNEWRGLGHTLLNTNYQQSVTNDIWDISEWIILSDYFKLSQ